MPRFQYFVTIFLFLGLTQASYPMIGEPCAADFDCREGWEYCKNEVCAHKGLFPIVALDIVGHLVILLILVLSNIGGVGGCGIVIPTAMALFGFDAKGAIALSNLSIFVSGLLRFFFNIK